MRNFSGSAMTLLASLSMAAYVTPASAGLIVHHDLDNNGVNEGTSGATNDGTLTGAAANTVSAWVNTTTTSLDTVVSWGVNGNRTKYDIDLDGVVANENGRLEVGVGGGQTVGAERPADHPPPTQVVLLLACRA